MLNCCDMLSQCSVLSFEFLIGKFLIGVADNSTLHISHSSFLFEFGDNSSVAGGQLAHLDADLCAERQVDVDA